MYIYYSINRYIRTYYISTIKEDNKEYNCIQLSKYHTEQFIRVLRKLNYKELNK